MRRTIGAGGRCRTLKRRYKDHESARRALVNLAKRGPRRGSTLVRCYQCPHCNGWHLTSQEEAS